MLPPLRCRHGAERRATPRAAERSIANASASLSGRCSVSELENMPGSFARRAAAPERELSPAELLELRLDKVRRRCAEEEEDAWRSTPRPLLSSAQLAERVERQRDYQRAHPLSRRTFSTETRALLCGDHKTRAEHLKSTGPAFGPSTVLQAIGGGR